MLAIYVVYLFDSFSCSCDDLTNFESTSKQQFMQPLFSLHFILDSDSISTMSDTTDDHHDSDAEAEAAIVEIVKDFFESQDGRDFLRGNVSGHVADEI